MGKGMGEACSVARSQNGSDLDKHDRAEHVSHQSSARAFPGGTSRCADSTHGESGGYRCSTHSEVLQTERPVSFATPLFGRARSPGNRAKSRLVGNCCEGPTASRPPSRRQNAGVRFATHDTCDIGGVCKCLAGVVISEKIVTSRVEVKPQASLIISPAF